MAELVDGPAKPFRDLALIRPIQPWGLAFSLSRWLIAT